MISEIGDKKPHPTKSHPLTYLTFFTRISVASTCMQLATLAGLQCLHPALILQNM